jgi:hypothetical protein
MASATPSERSQRSRLAAHVKWSKQDPVAGTKAARETFLAGFEDEVDPERLLDPAERTRRALHARKAYFVRLALASARARRSRRTS